MAEGKKFRVRDQQLHIMVTSYEKQLILDRVKASGSNSLREYVIEAAINNYIINVDYAELKNIAYEINKIGVNINQITHQVNTNPDIKAIYQTNMDKLQDDMDKIWQLIRMKLLHI